MLSDSHVVDTHTATASDSGASGCSMNANIYTINLFGFNAVVKVSPSRICGRWHIYIYTFGVRRHCQIPVQSLAVKLYVRILADQIPVRSLVTLLDI